MYGRIIRTDRNDLSTEAELDGYSIYERDHLGQNNKTTNLNPDGTVTSRTSIEFDAYGRKSKDIFLDKDGNIMWERSFEYNAYGQVIRQHDDRGVVGKWDNGDVISEYTRDTDPAGTLLGQKITTPSKVTYEKWSYDEFGRRALTLDDTNGDGEISAGENYVRHTYVDDTANAYINYYYTGDDSTLRYKIYAHRDGNMTVIGRLNSNNKGEFTALNYDGWGVTRSSEEDYTNDSRFQKVLELAEGKLEVITLSNATQSTVIGFDNDTLAKLTSSQLRIAGDATDTVNLKDSAEFTKLANTVRVSGQDYNQYTTTVDGKSYTLLIDTDVNVNAL